MPGYGDKRLFNEAKVRRFGFVTSGPRRTTVPPTEQVASAVA